MKFLTLALLLSFNTFAKDLTINDAPMEWLISSTLAEKMYDDDFDENHKHDFKKDPLVTEILQSIKYDPLNDEMIILNNKSTEGLKEKLISYLSKNFINKTDQKYLTWKQNSHKKSPQKVRLFKVKTKRKSEGYYYFNHVHTDISQDNSSLKWLKISPKNTFKIIESFLKRRNTQGVVAFTDHDTDKAFDQVSSLQNNILSTLRGVEWGGATHMCLIDIDKDWSELSNGRKYEGEESIKMSRSSNGFRIVNHPNRKKVFPYTSWGDANGVEVWNTIMEGAPFTRLNLKRSNNRDALKQWNDSLKQNKQYTAVAGSDFHFIIPCLRDRSLHYPANFIPAKDTAKAREYLDQGRVSFLTRPTAPKLTLKAKFTNQSHWHHMGDRVFNSDKNIEVELYADFSDVHKRIGGACYNTINTFYKLFTFWKKRFWEVRFYNKNGDVIAKRTLNAKKYNSKNHFRMTFPYELNDSDIIRAELWEINKKNRSVDLLGATNPIYFN